MKKLLTVLIISCMSINFSSGQIPTTDVATVGQLLQNALEAAQQAKDQLDKLQDQIDYYKKLYEGNWNLGEAQTTIENELGLPKDWKEIFDDNKSNVETSREEYELSNNNESLQQEYDSYLTQMEFYKKTYQQNIDRANRLRQLSTLLNTATTPQQKADLNNKLAYEQLALQADKQAMENMDRLLSQQEQLRQKQKENKFNKLMFGDK